MNIDAFNQELRDLLRRYDLHMCEQPYIELKLPKLEASWDGVVPVCRTVTKIEVRIDVIADRLEPWFEDTTRRRGGAP